MIGRTLSHYKIVGQLGAGGMGVVYSAEDSRLGRQVALKFVSSDFANDEQAILRLRSEARAASALNHPNICTIYDIGEADGHPFIVMELMKGQSLRDRLSAGPMKITPLVDIGTEVADALHAAHSEGIIHRDIKPGNIFINERGHVKILDFGLAKLTSTLTTTTTTDRAPHTSLAGVTHGTPAYMSPEQATGETLDGRTDLFSLGVVLYECATGHHPFPGKTPAVVLAGILDRAPASPLTYQPDLPARLVEIISNCLEKDRELRYQSAADLRADLKRLRRDLDSGAVRSIERSGTAAMAVPRRDADAFGTPRSGRSDVTPDSATIAITTTPAPAIAPVAAPRPGRAGRWAIAGLAAALVAGAGAAIVLWPRTEDDATRTTGPVVAPESTSSTTPGRVSTDAQLAAALASLQAGNYRAALAGAREVLALDPASVEAAKIRDQAMAMLATFDTTIADARGRLSDGDFAGAARLLEAARAIDASSPTLAELSGRLSDASRSRDTRAAVKPTPPETSRRTQVASAAKPAPPPAAPPAAVVTSPPPQATLPVPSPPQVAAPPITPAPRATEPPPRTEAVPPPVPAPAPPPRDLPSPPAAANTAEADDAAIRSVISTYGRAIEGKDLKLFRTIKPNLTAEEERRLQEGFRAVASQRVSLTVISLERKGDQASAVVRRRDELEAGGRRQTSDSRQTLTLSRSGNTWIITEIR